MIVEWNELLPSTLGSTPPMPPLLMPRAYAMMHIAMFDAVAAIERRYDPYRVRLQHVGGSTEAAAAQAPHDVLTSRITSPDARGLGADGLGTVTSGFAIWNNIARDVSASRGLGLLDTPRVFALLNVSIHDVLHTTQTSKFVHGLWRPVTAIRSADIDLNPDTDRDPGWLPLIPTPPYPTYAGKLAGIGFSTARALQLAFRTNQIPVGATWSQSGGRPDITHHFDGFWEAAQEAYDSRIYGGIHYRFDQVASEECGRKVAEFVFANSELHEAGEGREMRRAGTRC